MCDWIKLAISLIFKGRKEGAEHQALMLEVKCMKFNEYN
jgi:hypothetical protein